MSTIVQPAPNTAAYPLAVTSVEALKPWTMGAAGADALRAGQNAYADYLSGPFASWLVNYQAGHADEPAPAPPMGKVAQMAPDGLSWDLIDGSTPSGPVPSYQKRVESTNPTGTNPFASMSGSRPLLVAQIGGRATQSDGTVWLRIG